MDGLRAILFATDPPYLVDYDGMNHPGKAGKRKKKNKNWSDSYGPAFNWDAYDANPQLYEKFIAAAIAQAIDPHAAWYCWHASRRQVMVENAWTQHGAFVHQQIIWVKDRPILNRSWYTWQHEPCFFGWLKGNKPPRRSEDYPSTIWQVPTIAPGQNTEHPTSKPVELFAIPMGQHTRRGEVCYEPFCGSGTQLIAAQKLGRRCFAMEISPHYCDVIVRRWIAFIGDKAPADLVERYRRIEVGS
jgi:DNA modification methylase